MNGFLELRQVVGNVLRWWWLVILATVMAALIGYTVSQRQTPVYEATLTILVGQSLQSTNVDRAAIQASEILAQNYATIARGQPIMKSVADTLNLTESWSALRSRVHVEPIEGTQLLQIRVEANSPEKAEVIAGEIARQLILLSSTALQNQVPDENQQFVRQRLDGLRAKIEAGQESVREKELELAGSLTDAQRQEIQGEIIALEALITDWENNFTQFLTLIRDEQSPNYLAIVEPAYAKSRPIRPRFLINTIVAGAVGLSLALGLIFLLEFSDDTLKSTEEVSQSLDLTTLGTIQRIRGRHYSNKLITLKKPFSAEAEAYRIIQSNIQFMSKDWPVKSILVTSPASGEGKSVTVANLGVVMAQAGFNTIIVDTNLRQPALHQVFNIPNGKGLAHFLRKPEHEITNYLTNTSLENLHILNSGAKHVNPSELLGSRRVEALLAGLNELADLIIFDSPPVLAASDAAVLANRVDGVLLVIEAGKTRADAARHAISNLQHADARLLGAVLNRGSK